MKTTKFAVTVVALLFVVGCGGVDVGGVPINVGDINLNGDINFGDINLDGDAFEDELLDGLTKELAEESPGEETPDEETPDDDVLVDKMVELSPRPHPADTNGDFSISNDELLAYGVAFQNGGQDQVKSWLDVAVSIWQARTDGAYFDDMESTEPFNWQSVVDDEPNQPEPHPADIDGDFLLTGEEVLAYASSFQSGELPDGQDESWLDAAVDIWQARADGAYFDDMESVEPLNWKSMDESGVVADEVDDNEVEEISDATTDTAGEGYDILFKVTPLSPVSFDLTVIDPTEKWNSDFNAPAELGWAEGMAWDGFYRVQVRAGSNYNGVNEQVRFSISIYKDGELVLKEEHAVAEQQVWDDLSIAYP